MSNCCFHFHTIAISIVAMKNCRWRWCLLLQWPIENFQCGLLLRPIHSQSLINCFVKHAITIPIWLVFMTDVELVFMRKSRETSSRICYLAICKMNELTIFIQQNATWTFANCFEWSVFYDSFRRFKFHYIDVKRRVRIRVHTLMLAQISTPVVFGKCCCWTVFYTSSWCKVKSIHRMLRHAAIFVQHDCCRMKLSTLYKFTLPYLFGKCLFPI